MPEFNEQLEHIARLRAQTRQHDDAAYEARIGARRAQQHLARAKRGETIVLEDRQAEVARLRTQMAAINEQLAALRARKLALEAELERIRAQRQMLDDLKARRAAALARLQVLEQRLREIQQHQEHDPAASDETAALLAEIERLKAAIAEIDAAIETLTALIARERQHEPQLREELAALGERADGLRADLAGLQDRITELQQPVLIDRQPIEADIAALEDTAKRHRQLAGTANADLAGAIGGLYRQDPHPRGPLARLDDAVPFLLFPLRIETIFEGSELRVRVFPDDIVVHTHEATLTDREVDAGRLYWVELLVAEHLRTQRDTRRADAWRHVVDLFGGQRGAWVALNTRPADWAALAAAAQSQSLVAFIQAADATLIPGLLAQASTPALRALLAKAVADNDGDAFFELVTRQAWNEQVNSAARKQIAGFPAADLTRTDAWSRAPRTRVLPDRFVLLLYAQDGSAPQEIPGALVADTVFVGPDPLDPATTLVKDGSVRTFDGDCKWLADFDTAVQQGLGFKVPLDAQQMANGFARVLVFGLRLSAGATHGAEMLEELIANHRYGPKGFSLMAQGTPTNNTERDGSGYSDNDPYDDLQFYSAIDPPAFDPDAADERLSHTDGRLLADALGISYAALQSIPSAEQTDVLEARAMNKALFAATLGYWLKTWMSPVVTPDVARLTREFFVEHVTGRGPLPAIRVGNQPYGVLVTSDASRWKYPTPAPSDGRFGLVIQLDQMTPYLRKLHALLLQLQSRWQGMVKDVAHVGAANTDSANVLMSILGLHPTSVEFFQRIGFHQLFLDDFKNFVDPRGRYGGEFYSLIQNMPSTARVYLEFLGIHTTTAELSKTTALNVLWQHYVASLDVPSLVENKPPSESNALVDNYIEWLLNAPNTDKIVQESFPGKAPSTLLYLMLRNALLLQLHAGAYQWLKDRADYTPALERSLDNRLLMPGVSGSVPGISRYELMSVKVDAVVAAHPAPGTSVADWIRNGPPAAEVEAAFAQQQRAALKLLVETSTAKLERCLVEHLDCCQYRLDAWQTGLFAQRLSEQRRSGAHQDRRTGVYLGAFGWVENLKPTPRVRLRPESLPSVLRPAATDTGPLLEEDEVPLASAAPNALLGSRRGGFMHAPSINHAAAAALLRNAYLSHADSAQADVLSNNLSSGRVRRAQFVLEGMRNGQPIEALLGYQFERALHDLTSRSAQLGEVPVLELNEFIEPYRQAFPLEAREIAQAGTGPASESIPPYSVVNGLALMSATLDTGNAFGLASVLGAATPPGAAQGLAIVQTRDALTETLDAVKDLLTAENAYQLVQGNFDRVAAVSLAQKDARVPPTLEVLNTPRGSQFTFAHRVTLHFDDLDASAAANRPWPAPMTPRALAEPGINFWLGTVLGRSPEDASCKVWHVQAPNDENAAPLDPHFVTLADLELQPVDFVALASINAGDQRGATELEQRVARHYRSTQGIALDAVLRIDFDPADAPGDVTIGQLLPLTRRLRGLLAECRALDARDFLPSAGGKATTVAVDKNNPAGLDVAELAARVGSIASALATLADRLDGPAAANITITLLHDADDAGDDETFTGKTGAAFDKLDEARVDFTDTADVQVTFSLLDAQQLQSTLHAVAAFGIVDAFTAEIDLTGDTVKRSLLSRARRVARRLRSAEKADGVLDRAAALIAAASADKPVTDQVASLLQASQILFGDSFKCLPQFTCHNQADLIAADSARAQLLAFALADMAPLDASALVDEWLQGVARVRPRMNTWETVRMLADALNDVRIDMRPAQVPFRANDSWLAVVFPEKDPLDATKPFGITRDTLSITAHGAAAFRSGVQRGLLLDEWSEEIPTASENTGISFRFNQPNAVPPQTMLLAVTPEQTGAWSWDSLVGILTDTLARAKRRAVEPAQLEKEGLTWNLLAPATVSEFSMVAPADVSLDLMRVAEYATLDELYTAISKR